MNMFLVSASSFAMRTAVEMRLSTDAGTTAVRPPIFLPMAYGAAAANLGTAALLAGPGTPRALLASTALAVVCDFGPSAVRDVTASSAATKITVANVIDASPPSVLVDNFVTNIGAKDNVAIARRDDFRMWLKRCNQWSALVRFRVVADGAGLLLMLKGPPARAGLGAALILTGHTLFWFSGAAAARLRADATPAPLSPPLVRLIGGTTASLASLATVAALGRGAWVQAACGWAYAIAMTVIELARIIADLVRDRTHVGI